MGERGQLRDRSRLGLHESDAVDHRSRIRLVDTVQIDSDDASGQPQSGDEIDRRTGGFGGDDEFDPARIRQLGQHCEGMIVHEIGIVDDDQIAPALGSALEQIADHRQRSTRREVCADALPRQQDFEDSEIPDPRVLRAAQAGDRKIGVEARERSIHQRGLPYARRADDECAQMPLP